MTIIKTFSHDNYQDLFPWQLSRPFPIATIKTFSHENYQDRFP